VLYDATKFPNLDYTSTAVSTFRNKWFGTFRDQLDACYLGVTGGSRHGGDDHMNLIRDLEAIQDYKIHARPDLVTKASIHLGRKYFIKSRRLE
jgi:hypothetical protein